MNSWVTHTHHPYVESGCRIPAFVGSKRFWLANPHKIFSYYFSKARLTYTIPVSTTIPPQQKQLAKPPKSSIQKRYEWTSRPVIEDEKTLICSKNFTSDVRKFSLIYSPTHHLLSKAASILQRHDELHDELVKGVLLPSCVTK